jgi:sigma-B regulation protein RsbU (phosphoserine phosphatase)
VKFRSALILAGLGLVLAVLAATLGTVAVVLNRAARIDAADDLARAHVAFNDLLQLRRTLHRSEAHVVAEEPRLKAVAATQDITPETVMGVARELRRAIGSDLFLITDAEGRVLADVDDPAAHGASMRDNPVVGSALKESSSSGVWTERGAVYEVEARRLGFGETTVGVVVLGYRLDGRFAVQAAGQTGTGFLLELDGKLLGTALPASLGDGTAAQAATDTLTLAARPAAVTVAGVPALAQRFALPGYTGPASLHYTVINSLAAALEPKHRLFVLLVLIGGFALLAAFGGSALLARRLSRPVDDLVAFTQVVAAEQLEKRTTPHGPVELIELGLALNRMVGELADSRAAVAQKQRLENELEIATRIQTSILPRNVQVAGLDVAAAMKPADEVGGDYYDVQPATDGCWIGVGDVAGHGLTAGLVMMMTQSAIAALVRARPTASPGELVAVLNRIIFDNVQRRLGQREHMTLSLLRYQRDGNVRFAGAHEDIIICRANGKTELVETPGTWIGAVEDVSAFSTDYDLKLEDGDLMILHSDGITQASQPGPGGGLYGIERLCSEIERLHDRPVQEICDQIMSEVLRWSPVLQDDATLMVLRYKSE